MIATDRDKMKAIRGTGRKVTRFLPDRIGRMMVAYMAWLLPAERTLRRKCRLPEPRDECTVAEPNLLPFGDVPSYLNDDLVSVSPKYAVWRTRMIESRGHRIYPPKIIEVEDIGLNNVEISRFSDRHRRAQIPPFDTVFSDETLNNLKPFAGVLGKPDNRILYQQLCFCLKRA